MKKLIMKLAISISTGILGVIMLSSSAFAAGGYTLFGTATYVSPGNSSLRAVQTTSSGFSTYGGIDFSAPAGLTVANLNTLSTDFNATMGGCGGGSPRFSVSVTTPSNTSVNLFFYLGTEPSYNCLTNTWLNSGNLATSTNLVDASQLGGAFYEPYSLVQSTYGSYPVTDIALVTDGGWAVGGTQTIIFDNTMINNSTYTYEPTKLDCKKGGWMNLSDANGNSFKNQGDCVSYFENGH